MRAPVVTAVAAHVPPAVPLEQWRRIEAQFNATALTGWARLVYPPWFATYGLDLQRLTAPPEDVWPVSAQTSAHDIDFVPIEQRRDLSGLAAHVAQAIYPRRGGEAPQVGVVMFCHSSLNEHVSTTTAGRLCTVIGKPCFPFAVAQQQGASVFTALRLASDLLVTEPGLCAILVVAAEKWCHPLVRNIGGWTVQGDAAGAILLERDSPSTRGRGLRLLDTAVQSLGRADAPFGLPASLADTNAAFVPALLCLIDTLLRRNGVRANEIASVIPHHVNGPLVDAVSRQLGVRRHRRVTDRRAYLGAAESIVRLAETLDSSRLRHGEFVLAWGIGLGGYVSCTLLEAHGTPALCFTGASPTGES
jgi:3-oxoacyl-[acyl-carrier-protein] synthase III